MRYTVARLICGNFRRTILCNSSAVGCDFTRINSASISFRCLVILKFPSSIIINLNYQ